MKEHSLGKKVINQIRWHRPGITVEEILEIEIKYFPLYSKNTPFVVLNSFQDLVVDMVDI